MGYSILISVTICIYKIRFKRKYLRVIHSLDFRFLGDPVFIFHIDYPKFLIHKTKTKKEKKIEKINLNLNFILILVRTKSLLDIVILLLDFTPTNQERIIPFQIIHIFHSICIYPNSTRTPFKKKMNKNKKNKNNLGLAKSSFKGFKIRI